MAKMTGVWIYVAPRSASDDVNITCGATIILSEAEKHKIGNSLMNVSCRVMDDDAVSDDTVHVDNSFQLGPALLNIGPSTFQLGVIVPHSKVQDSEPGSESWAELYCRVRASGGGVTTNWANSQNWDVRYE
jgi:hypothetical protein